MRGPAARIGGAVGLAAAIGASCALAQPSPVPGYSARDLNIVAGNLSMIIVPCEIGAPAFVAKHAAVFEGYRRRHASAIAHVEGKPEHAAMVRQMKSPQGIEQARAMAGAFCQEKVVPNLARLARAADSRFATPEGSWDHLRASLAAGDRAQALLVIDPGYPPLVERIEGASASDLKAMASRMGDLEITRSLPDRVQAVERGADGKPKGMGVTFQSYFGEWWVADGLEGAFAR